MTLFVLPVVMVTLGQPAPTDALTAGAALAFAAPNLNDPEALRRLAEEDPLELISLARERGATRVHDYSCVFTKTERVRGKMQPRSVYRVRYRDAPRTVYMEAVAEKPRVRRVLYEAGRRLDRKGRELMKVEPGGWQRMLVSEAEIPIKDKRVLKTNRTTIDQFGFHHVLERFWSISQKAQARGALDISYSGEGTVDGRPTFIVTRNLPQSKEYTYARVILHLDQEWLMPVAVDCYGDHAEKQLLGRYRSTRVRLNHLREADFNF